MAGARIPDGPAKSFNSPDKPGVKPGASTGFAFPQKEVSGKAAIPGKQTILTSELFKGIAANLGFPKDTLSVTLLAFARFFSLPPSQKLIANLRQEILTLLKTASPETAAEKSELEAKAMAALIAADKGVNLHPEALERYARLLIPPAWEPHGSDEKEHPHHKEESAAQDCEENSLEEPPNPEELQAIAQAQTDYLLDFLNSLPGKNGQYWLVFPFIIKFKGTEIKVFIRILSSELLSSGDDGQLIADIFSPKRQWRWFIKKTTGKFLADIRVYPECSQKALNLLQKEAERFLGKSNGFEEILVRNSDEAFSLAEDLCAECLPFINEEI